MLTPYQQAAIQPLAIHVQVVAEVAAGGAAAVTIHGRTMEQVLLTCQKSTSAACGIPACRQADTAATALQEGCQLGPDQ